MATKVPLSLVQRPSTYSIFNEAGQKVYTAAVPLPEVVTVPQTGLAPGGPGVVQQASILPVGSVSKIFDFIKNNPAVLIGGAVVVGLLLQKKRRK